MLSVNIFPNDIKDIQINKTVAVQVYELLKEADMHLMLYGYRGMGKKTVVQSVFNTMFPDDKISECPIKNFEGDNAADIIPIKMSSNYVEINCNLIRNQSRNSILEFLKDICKNYVFGSDGNIQKRYVIIHDLDILSVNLQYSMRRIMELYTDTVVFVFTTSAFNKIIDAFKSRCLCLRVTADKNNILDLMKKMGIAKRSMQAKLRNNDTILEAFLEIDNIQGNNESYDLMADFIKGKNGISVVDAKQTLHNVMSMNVDYHIIIKNIMKLLKIEKMNPEKICKMHQAISETDIMCVNGSKIVICLEYLVFRLKNIVSS